MSGSSHQTAHAPPNFAKGQVDGVTSPQTVLVNGTPYDVKDLCRCESAIIEEDENDTSSGNEMGVVVTCESEGRHSSAQSTSEEDTKDENDQTSRDKGNVETRRKSTLHFLEEAPGRNGHHEIRAECSENWDENRHSPQHKRQRICSTCKILFS